MPGSVAWPRGAFCAGELKEPTFPYKPASPDGKVLEGKMEAIHQQVDDFCAMHGQAR